MSFLRIRVEDFVVEVADLVVTELKRLRNSNRGRRASRIARKPMDDATAQQIDRIAAVVTPRASMDRTVSCTELEINVLFVQDAFLEITEHRTLLQVQTETARLGALFEQTRKHLRTLLSTQQD